MTEIAYLALMFVCLSAELIIVVWSNVRNTKRSDTLIQMLKDERAARLRALQQRAKKREAQMRRRRDDEGY